ncbi:FixH family protein [Wenxinia marina]|uniref:Putative integral membrane protein linked to a cation pump n=1 Tax=Wenxinia marina DSM 24838 TaxID=1123501 RepID=A0A0D0PHR3_9RHOB|nr:FixH family protein [Wenxinia marina]KIQ70931.1 putative integral membrane protein linked to a cation pump [Wenxinia marina DSM 24838]GGL56222.1 RdxH [Wenxinia marina]
MTLNPFRGPITGPKFFAIFASFFVVIIAVNVVLAVQAVRTFPGLEVANSYVASQTFDRERAAQEALGWTVAAEVRGGVLRLSITDAAGAPVEAAEVTGTFGRATSVRDDQVPAFVFDGSAYVAPVAVSGGNWNLRLEAVAQDGTPFHQRVIVRVTE